MPDAPVLDAPVTPVTVVETVTESVFPTPTFPPPEPTPTEPPTAVLEPEVNDQLRSLVDDINGLNAQLEGTGDTAGLFLLDPDQFTALGFALVLIVALLAALLIVAMRR